MSIPNPARTPPAAYIARLKAERRRRRVVITAWQVAIGVVFLGLWQLLSGPVLDPNWFSRPDAVAARIVALVASGDIWTHAAFTLAEMVLGFTIGSLLGAAAGVGYGSAPRFERI